MDERRDTLRRRVPLALALVFVGIGLARLLDARDHGAAGLAVLVVAVVLAIGFVAPVALSGRHEG